MSMHKQPLTEIEESGLKAHRLAVGTPSQLSDAFRLGIAWCKKQLSSKLTVELVETKTSIDVMINNTNFGTFDIIDAGGNYIYFPKRQDQMTGDHYIAIGEALNKINNIKQ